jgi:hypothetical protein
MDLNMRRRFRLTVKYDGQESMVYAEGVDYFNANKRHQPSGQGIVIANMSNISPDGFDMYDNSLVT